MASGQFYRERFGSDKAVLLAGFNAVVGITTDEIIEAGGGTYPFPTTAETLRVKAGGNAADTAAGAGAREVTVVFLDANFEVQTEQLVTAGASASAATTLTARRVLEVFVSESGTYGAANTAAVVIENTTATQVLATIPTAEGRASAALYTIPANHRGLVVGLSMKSDALCQGRLWYRTRADDTTAPLGAPRLALQGNEIAAAGEWKPDLTAPLVLPEKTDVWASALGGAGACAVSAVLSLVLLRDG